MNSITIILPLPDESLSPNARVHWMKKAKAAKLYRWEAQCKIVAKSPRRLMWEKASYKAAFYFKDARRRDADNAIASLKSALDGVADAGLVINDSGLWPERPEFRTDKENPRVEITFTREA